MINSDTSVQRHTATAMKPYVLITPTRNEADYIENTLQAVIAQTVQPRKWVIVSDGSVDRTEEIVQQYAKKYEFILLVSRPCDQERDFSSKVQAIELGYEQLRGLEFDFVGNLDADISFDCAYYAGILSKFEQNERLGIAGGQRLDRYNARFRRVRSSQSSVPGAVQLFRRQCYETIGGYRRLRCGGIDAVAEAMARMHGWQVESFPEFEFYHHRPTGTAAGGAIKARFRTGMQHYLIGYHPMFHLARCVFRLSRYPWVVGSLAATAGYAWASLRRYERVVPDDFVRYLRQEQGARLRSLLLTRQDPALRPWRFKPPQDRPTSTG